MWRKITEDDIQATLSQIECDAFRQSYFGEKYFDAIELLSKRAAAMVRGYLATNGNIRMSPNEYEIPEATISPAMDYLVIDILKRLDIAANEDRRNARKDAIALFDKIAQGRVGVESYGKGDDKPTGGSCAVVIQNSRDRVNAQKLEGL